MATLSDISTFITGLGNEGLSIYRQVSAPTPPAALTNTQTAVNQAGFTKASSISTYLLIGAGLILLIAFIMMFYNRGR